MNIKPHSRRFYLLTLLLLIFAVPLYLSGCGSSSSSSPSSPSPSSPSSSIISGTVDGGPSSLNYQLTVSLYETGSLTALGSDTTSNGAFTISFNAPSNQGLLYLVVQGTGTNSNIELISILESSGNSNLSQSGVVINELSTVASEYALNAFNASLNAAGNITFPSSLEGTSLTTTLNNLIAQFNNMYNSTGNSAGGLNGNLNINTQDTINMLANAISSCVSSPSGALCSTLYKDASTSSTEPIWEIVYSIITNANLPSGYNLSNIFTVASSETSSTGWTEMPSSAPSSLTFNLPVSVNTSYMPSSISNTTEIGSIAIDASGNLWVLSDTYSTSANTYTPQLVEISNGSVAKTINLSGIPSTSPGGNAAYGIAIDSSGNIWITDQIANSTPNSYTDQLVEISNGSIVKTITMPSNNSDALQIDASGNIWVPNYIPNSTSSTLEYSDQLVEVSNGAITNTFTLPSDATGEPQGIAIDSKGNIWIPTYNYNSSNDASYYELVEDSNSGNILQTISLPGGYDNGGGDIAIDPSGNIWLPNDVVNSSTTSSTNTYGIVEISNNKIVKTITIYPASTSANYSNYGINSIAIDSAGNVWVCGYEYDSSTNIYIGQLFEISNGVIANTIDIGNFDPFYITIDPSGNILISSDNFQNSGTSTTSFGYYSGNIIEIKNVASGGEYFPYSGPMFAGTSGFKE